MVAIISMLLLIGAGLRAQPVTSAPGVPTVSAVTAPAAVLVRVSLQTSMGTITLDLDKTHAPVTVANFLKYVDQKRLNGTMLYRAMKMEGGAGLIQGGASGDPRRILPPIAHEPTTQTGLSNRDGAIAMARGAPGTATADFFISIGDMSGLDAHLGQSGDNLGYAVFGRVVDGMDVVQRIFNAPVSPTKGEGWMKGQMLAVPVKIVATQRVKASAP